MLLSCDRHIFREEKILFAFKLFASAPYCSSSAASSPQKISLPEFFEGKQISKSNFYWRSGEKINISVLVLTRRGGSLSRSSNFNRKYFHIWWFCPHWANNVILSQKHNVMEKNQALMGTIPCVIFDLLAPFPPLPHLSYFNSETFSVFATLISVSKSVSEKKAGLQWCVPLKQILPDSSYLFSTNQLF